MKHRSIIVSFYIFLLSLDSINPQIYCFEEKKFFFQNYINDSEFIAHKIFWSIDNYFLILDKEIGSVYKFNSSYNRNKKIKNYNISEKFGKIVGIVSNSSGTKIIDQSNNQIFILDNDLNLLSIDILDLEIYPNVAAIDLWGKINLYSKRLNGIFLYEKDIESRALINFDQIPKFGNCVLDIEISTNGSIGVLDCDGEVYIFNMFGKFQYSYSLSIKNPRFILPYKENWLVFQENGIGLNINNRTNVYLPETKLKLRDITIRENKIAALYDSYILVSKIDD